MKDRRKAIDRLRDAVKRRQRAIDELDAADTELLAAARELDDDHGECGRTTEGK